MTHFLNPLKAAHRKTNKKPYQSLPVEMPMKIWRLPLSRDAFRVLGTLFWAERIASYGPDRDVPDYHPRPRDPEDVSEERQMGSSSLATGFKEDDFDRVEDAIQEIVKLKIICIIEMRETSFSYVFLPEILWGSHIPAPSNSGELDELRALCQLHKRREAEKQKQIRQGSTISRYSPP